MIGLEYLLELYDISHKELAEELKIRRQNISLWINGKQNISKKYLPYLSKKFNVSPEFLQKELTVIEKLEIEINKLESELDKSLTKVEDTIIDDNGKEQTITKEVYDTNIAEVINLKKLEIEKLKLIDKIEKLFTSNNQETFYEIKSTHEKYIKLLDNFTNLLTSSRVSNATIDKILMATSIAFDTDDLMDFGLENSPFIKELVDILDKEKQRLLQLKKQLEEIPEDWLD